MGWRVLTCNNLAPLHTTLGTTMAIPPPTTNTTTIIHYHCLEQSANHTLSGLPNSQNHEICTPCKIIPSARKGERPEKSHVACKNPPQQPMMSLNPKYNRTWHACAIPRRLVYGLFLPSWLVFPATRRVWVQRLVAGML